MYSLTTVEGSLLAIATFATISALVLSVLRGFPRAIQTTTAAPLCQSAMMLLSGKYSGIVLQSQIDPTEFMSGNFVSRIYR